MSDWSQHLPALQVIVPLLSAPLVLLLRPRGLAWAASTAASLFAFAIAIVLALGVLDDRSFSYRMGGWPAPYGIELGVDAFSALVLLVVTGASTLALIAGRGGLDSEIGTERQPLFYAAWLLALAGLVGIPVSADAFNIFVFMEISALASYVLIAGGADRRALPAVFKYLIMGTIGATFYLIGIGLIYLMTGTLNLADMELRIHEVADQKPILVAAGFITIGLALKAAVFPLHVWLPNAYTYAPNAVTVFLAACSTKVSLYLLLRFDFFVFQTNLTDHDIQFSYFLMPLAVLASILARRGVYQPPHLIQQVIGPDGEDVTPARPETDRVLSREVAEQVGEMMIGTTRGGTSRKSFRDLLLSLPSLVDSASSAIEYQSVSMRNNASLNCARITGSTGINGGCGKRSSKYSMITRESYRVRSRSTKVGTVWYGFRSIRSSGSSDPRTLVISILMFFSASTSRVL